MAVVAKIATIKFDNGLGSGRTWKATAATQDTAAGSSVVVTITNTPTGGALDPANPDTFTLRYVDDGGNVIRTVALNTTSASQTDTFFFTNDGTSGGTARCGMIELKIQVTKTTGGPTATYDYESDGAPATPPTGFTAPQVDRGWIRGTTTLTESISNISLGGGKSSPAQYNESLFVRLTQVTSSYVARALTVTLSAGSLSGSTNSSSGTTHDITFANVVDNRFAAAVTTVDVAETIPNAALTGLSDWTFTSITDDSITVDPRITAVHDFQLDDNAFGTPPYSKNNSTGQRLTSQIAYLTANLRAARGTLVGNVTTQGVNGLTIHTILQDAAAATTAITQDDTTATKGGETGWIQTFMQWTSALPGGSWNKTISITAPAAITGAGYLIGGAVSYTLLAVDPAIKLLIGADVTSTDDGNHFSPALALTVQGTLFNRVTAQAITPDASPAPYLSFFRYNQTTQKKQYLKTDFTWADATGVVDTFPMTVSPNDAKTYYLTLSAANTSSANGWTNDGVRVLITMYFGGTPYGDVIPIVVVSPNAHKHSKYAFDPTGLFK